MSDRIAHRGPDGQGEYLNHAGNSKSPQCGLVHRRLAIIDLDERALQPFSDPSGRYWLVFNGEIYNFQELRAELGLQRDWRTTCDTEVLLAGYETWGERCVERLNGMFAFAIWDQLEHSLFLARDRMGQKPLYLAWNVDRSAIAVASELAALREMPWFDATIDRAALSEYLHRGYIGGSRTIHRGALKLPPAHWMRIDGAGRVQTHRYFDPNARSAASSDPSEIRRLVLQSVRRQLVSDVPLGCFLSGGIDSSIIAAAMKQTVGKDQPVLTFSIGFDDPRYDETKYAARVARHLGTEHREFVVRPNAAEDLPRLAAVFGEPFADSSALPTHYLSRETRQHVKVALSGDGGDELFGGYDRYRAMRIGQRLRHIPGVAALASSELFQRLPGVHPKSPLTRVKRLLAGLDLPPERRYATYTALMDDAMVRRLMPDAPAFDEPVELYESLSSDRDVVQAALAADRASYLPDDLLAKVDRCSMLHALEVRSPFMDHELVTRAAGLSTDQLLAGGSKRMLRESFGQHLPPEILKRKKMGFAVPIGQWFRGELRQMLRDSVLASNSFAASHLDQQTIALLIDQHEREQVDHAQRLYALLMLELWWHAR